MEYEIFNIFKNYTLEALIIGFGAFLLTYLIKIPIKKKTSTLEENKRKMVNIVIMFIPLILSFIASVLYYGITENEWISLLIIDSAISSWLISLSLYAIVSRICLVIKGIKSGKLEINSNLTKEMITYIKDTINTLNKENKTTEKSLASITERINSLTKLKDLFCQDNSTMNLTEISDLNNEIISLQETEKEYKSQIKSNTEKINTYTETLYTKTNNKKFLEYRQSLF